PYSHQRRAEPPPMGGGGGGAPARLPPPAPSWAGAKRKPPAARGGSRAGSGTAGGRGGAAGGGGGAAGGGGPGRGGLAAAWLGVGGGFGGGREAAGAAGGGWGGAGRRDRLRQPGRPPAVGGGRLLRPHGQAGGVRCPRRVTDGPADPHDVGWLEPASGRRAVADAANRDRRALPSMSRGTSSAASNRLLGGCDLGRCQTSFIPISSCRAPSRASRPRLTPVRGRPRGWPSRSARHRQVCTWVRWRVCCVRRPVCGFGARPCGVESGPRGNSRGEPAAVFAVPLRGRPG